MFDCEYTVGEKGLTIVTYFWEVGDDVCLHLYNGGREDMFVCESGEVVMMFDWDFTLGDADMAVRVGCGDVGEPGEDVNGNHLGGKMRMVTIMMRIGEKRQKVNVKTWQFIEISGQWQVKVTEKKKWKDCSPLPDLLLLLSSRTFVTEITLFESTGGQF